MPLGSKRTIFTRLRTGHYKMVSESIPHLGVRFVWPHKGVCPFDPTIPWTQRPTIPKYYFNFSSVAFIQNLSITHLELFKTKYKCFQSEPSLRCFQPKIKHSSSCISNIPFQRTKISLLNQ